MDKLFNVFKKLSRPVIIFGLLGIAAIYLILGAVSSPDKFFPFISNGLDLLFIVCLYALPAILYLLKKDDVAKFFLFVLFAYYLVLLCRNSLELGSLINKNYATISIIYGVFGFIHGLLILACIVFFVLYKAFNINLLKILNLLVVITVAYFFIMFIVTLIRYIEFDADWTSYFSLLLDDFVMPFICLCAFCSFQEGKEPKEEKKEAKQEEVKEEKADNEKEVVIEEDNKEEQSE